MTESARWSLRFSGKKLRPTTTYWPGVVVIPPRQSTRTKNLFAAQLLYFLKKTQYKRRHSYMYVHSHLHEYKYANLSLWASFYSSCSVLFLILLNVPRPSPCDHRNKMAAKMTTENEVAPTTKIKWQVRDFVMHFKCFGSWMIVQDQGLQNIFESSRSCKTSQNKIPALKMHGVLRPIWYIPTSLWIRKCIFKVWRPNWHPRRSWGNLQVLDYTVHK